MQIITGCGSAPNPSGSAPSPRTATSFALFFLSLLSSGLLSWHHPSRPRYSGAHDSSVAVKSSEHTTLNIGCFSILSILRSSRCRKDSLTSHFLAKKKSQHSPWEGVPPCSWGRMFSGPPGAKLKRTCSSSIEITLVFQIFPSHWSTVQNPLSLTHVHSLVNRHII